MNYMNERIIISLTTWNKRINNIPVVLDTIFKQTVTPDLVVLNLAIDEVVPEDVQHYIDSHSIEVNRVSDTKVYKKLIPTLKKYPNDCVISIDDDWLYPDGMIEDFVKMHNRYPDYPISGNRIVMNGMQCHCGCASLQKACYFGEFIDYIDRGVIFNCPSDDMVYTYFSNKARHPYIRTSELYFENMTPYNNDISYSDSDVRDSGIKFSYDFLVKKYGKIENVFLPYIKDFYLSDLLLKIHERDVERESWIACRKIENEIKQTKAYRLGSFLLKPLIWIRHKFSQ